jgi:hypothetical protein
MKTFHENSRVQIKNESWLPSRCVTCDVADYNEVFPVSRTRINAFPTQRPEREAHTSRIVKLTIAWFYLVKLAGMS